MTSTPTSKPAEIAKPPEETEEGFEIVEAPSSLETFTEFWYTMCRYLSRHASQLALVGGVFTFGAAGLYFILKDKDHERQNECKKWEKELEQRRLASKTEADRHLEELISRVTAQIQREQEEDERLHQTQMVATQCDARKNDWEILQNDMDYQSESDRLKLAAEARLEKLKQEAALEKMMRDQMARAETFYSEQANKAELAEMQKELESERRNFKEALNEYDSRLNQAEVKQAEKESIWRREEEREEREFHQRLHEIRMQFVREEEEMRRHDAARRREMENQFYELQRQLQIKVWTMEIENNWTRRLNTLRNSYDDVKKAWQMPSEKPEMLKIQLEHAMKAVDIQRTLMVKEAIAMERMHRDTGKEFLLTIKRAVEDVKEECDRVEHALQSSPVNVHHINDCFSRLSKASLEIPTLAELKRIQGY